MRLKNPELSSSRSSVQSPFSFLFLLRLSFLGFCHWSFSLWRMEERVFICVGLALLPLLFPFASPLNDEGSSLSLSRLLLLFRLSCPKVYLFSLDFRLVAEKTEETTRTEHMKNFVLMFFERCVVRKMDSGQRCTLFLVR